MDTVKLKRIASSLVKDLPSFCVLVFVASVALTLSAAEEHSTGNSKDDQTIAFGMAKRSNNQHKFGWGKRSRTSAMDLDEELLDKRSADRIAALAGSLCKGGSAACAKFRVPYQRNGWNGGYGKRGVDEDEEENYAGDEERDLEEDVTPMERDANEDRNGWGGNYGRDLSESPNELRALLAAKKRVLGLTEKRHGNGWNGAYGKRGRNGWNSAYGKKKRSAS